MSLVWEERILLSIFRQTQQSHLATLVDLWSILMVKLLVSTVWRSVQASPLPFLLTTPRSFSGNWPITAQSHELIDQSQLSICISGGQRRLRRREEDRVTRGGMLVSPCCLSTTRSSRSWWRDNTCLSTSATEYSSTGQLRLLKFPLVMLLNIFLTREIFS